MRLTFLLLLSFSSCSYSVNVIHTQGKANDVVDEVQTTSPKISTDLTLPVL